MSDMKDLLLADYDGIFQIQDGRLPYNIKTSFVHNTNPIAMEASEVVPNKKCLKNCFSRQLCFCMSASVVLIPCVIIMTWIIFHNSQRDNDGFIRQNIVQDLSIAESKSGQISNVNNSKESNTFVEKRSRCHSKCWKYSAFTFRSSCEDGFCRCSGKGYNRETCLPEIGGCSITKVGHPSRKSKEETAHPVTNHDIFYTCQQETEKTVIVISVAVRRYSKASVHVQYHGNISKNSVLVLCSNYPVHWSLESFASFKTVRLLSENRPRETSFSVSQSPLEGSAEFPIVTSYRHQVGYGEDSRRVGRTPKMLQTITTVFGPITYFHGSEYLRQSETNISLSI